MSNDRSTSPINVPASDSRPRRGSVASGLPFTDLFSKNNQSAKETNAQTGQGQRRLSITTLGLSGSPTQTSAFGNMSLRRGSLSSSWGSAPNEDAVAEDAEGGLSKLPICPTGLLWSSGSTGCPVRQIPPSIPTARPTARSPASTATSPQDERSNVSRRVGEGFNWSEALRSRAERAPSLGGPASPQSARQSHHQRAASIASMEQPIREIPKQPKQKKPDFFQEKILRGDFMD
ncbi:hypothetical protein N7451_004527 [Penicillium sp. IBT 35674x]|nr:hypothetical protein N7451_004527 [Penicillium sp. IBT 35674x]